MQRDPRALRHEERRCRNLSHHARVDTGDDPTTRSPRKFQETLNRRSDAAQEDKVKSKLVRDSVMDTMDYPDCGCGSLECDDIV